MKVGDLVKLRMLATKPSQKDYPGVIVNKIFEPDHGFVFEVLWADSNNVTFVRPSAIELIN